MGCGLESPNMRTWKKEDIFKLVFAAALMGAMAILFLPFLPEVLLAAVFAFAIEPGLGRFLQNKHLRWKSSVAGILAAMFLVVAGPISFAGYRIYIFFAGISRSGFQNSDIFKKPGDSTGANAEILRTPSRRSMHLEDKFRFRRHVGGGHQSASGGFVVELSTQLLVSPAGPFGSRYSCSASRFTFSSPKPVW